MTRIISGIAKGRNIKVPSSGTRPTSDRVREAIFTSLTSRLGNFSDLDVLDLFAGSGAFGLEALSRGAKTCTLVEKNLAAAKIIKDNASTLNFDVEIKTVDVKAFLKDASTKKFDLVFVDPPYELPNDEIEMLLALLIQNGHVAQDAVVVVERSARGAAFEWPNGFAQVQERTYGETLVKSGVC